MKLVIFAAFNLKNNVKKKKNASVPKTFFCYVITPLELVLVTDTHINYSLIIANELEGNYKRYHIWAIAIAHFSLFSL